MFSNHTSESRYIRDNESFDDLLGEFVRADNLDGGRNLAFKQKQLGKFKESCDVSRKRNAKRDKKLNQDQDDCIFNCTSPSIIALLVLPSRYLVVILGVQQRFYKKHV